MEANELVPNLTEEQSEKSKKQIKNNMRGFVPPPPGFDDWKIQKEIDKKNEIKKILYKQNPQATLTMIRKGVAYYQTLINCGEINAEIVRFEVPVSKMDDADYFAAMPAKLLIFGIV
jgi:hypothetical protein